MYSCYIRLVLLFTILFVIAEAIRNFGVNDDMPRESGRRGRGNRRRGNGNRNGNSLKQCFRDKCREDSSHCSCLCKRRPNSRICRKSCKCETEGNGNGSGEERNRRNKKDKTKTDGIEGVKGRKRAREIKKLVDEIVKGDKIYSRADRKGNSFERTQKQQDNFGNLQVRMRQLYRDIPILGAEIVAQRLRANTIEIQDRDTQRPTGERKRVKAKNYDMGVFVDELDQTLGRVQVRNSPRQALEHFMSNNGHSSVSDEVAETMIYRNEAGEAQVVTYCSYFTDENEKPTKPAALIDENDKIITKWEDLKLRSIPNGRGPGGNKKVGYYYYGKDKPNFQVTQSGGTCTLESSDVRTIHLQWANSNGKTTAHSFNCYDQNQVEVNGGYAPLNDAHFFGQKIFDMYQYWYKKDPLKSKPLLLKVHYGRNYQNAFWDGHSMTFGDGASYFYPLVSLDITAHEIAHGVTQQSSGLLYYGQSGGLNEAFSDMAGKAAERYVRGKSGVNWGVGRDITKRDEPLRCMDNPPCDGRSIDNVNNFYNGMDPHYSSGPFNKVFHLISQKLFYDVWDAFDIFYIANTKFWATTTTYEQAAEAALRTVDELKQGYHLPWGFHWVKIQDIVDAFRQIGLTCSRSGQYWDCRK